MRTNSILVAAIAGTFALAATAAFVTPSSMEEVISPKSAMKSDEGVPHNLVTALKSDEGVPHNLISALQFDEGRPEVVARQSTRVQFADLAEQQ